MQALALGLIAALAWGIHDICVRSVGRSAGIYQALFTVLVFGCVLIFAATVLNGNSFELDGATLRLSALAGASFAIGGIGVYNAFALGPVRLVAPLVGSFPVLSVAWAAFNNSPVSLGQWVAVFAIVFGIALVARQSSPTDQHYNRNRVVLWAVLAAVGLALTFAFGQAASDGDESLPVIFATRVVAMISAGLVLLVFRPREEWTLPPLNSLPLIFAMGFLDTTALGVVLAAGSLPYAEFAAVTSSVFGLVTVLIAWIFLREPINRIQWTGILVVFTSIAYLASG